VQIFERLGISFTVAMNLSAPIVCVGFRFARTPIATMPMPKTSVNEDCSSQTGEHKVRPTRQIGAVQAEAETKRMS
jgi:hypothetical protein